MKIGRVLGIVIAIVLHLGVLLFGGIFFKKEPEKTTEIREVDLVGTEVPTADKPEALEPEKAPDALEERDANEEQLPDAAEVIRSLDEASAAASAPALEAASLSSIEAALSGGAPAGEGDFANAVSFASGGRIGGTGRAATLEEKFESAFSLSEIDQRPRAVFQSAPVYPPELRGKKVDGSVTLIFIVDASGRVVNPKVEKSSNPIFEKPALEAVRQWKFEPALKGGTRVDSRSRVSIRFAPTP
jgi:TonB family protein